MLNCSVCKLPSTKMDNGYVCPNGHMTTRLKEMEERKDWQPGSQSTIKRKRPKQTIRDLISTISSRELCTLIALRYLHSLLREYEIPKSAFLRYKSLYYSFATYIEKLPNERLGPEYRTITEVFVFLVKRDLEEKKDRLYTLLDFKRKHNGKNLRTNKFTVRKEYFKTAYLRTLVFESASNKMSINSIKNLLQCTFPNCNEYFSGVFGLMSENALSKMCAQLGLTMTKRMAAGFALFKENLVHIRFHETYNKFLFSELLIGAYLIMYSMQMCDLTPVHGRLVFVERAHDLGEGNVAQDFFCREIYMSNLKQLNYYLEIIEKYDGNKAPVFNPIEFPAPTFGVGKADAKTRRQALHTIGLHIANTIGEKITNIFDVTKSILAIHKKLLDRLKPA
ncbi:hypothetical protein NEMIN01_0492 [Nematocida minor]|uniref:uncharacterized protein n=1 Tax=Nematocida minor TaxID=1912983 RepID=UPI00221EE1A5|nr:uncharacterized protein NEMIN01_0492 [Nematocida minor]KAI5189429.1 hypothetical protein NEMIN01_0492 [Nematocida minor]